eukprot:m.31718 g.31718  ORF g.31718 m.31718 type:complete len:657 (+) comp9456_c0_seq1:283-2253(+)
MAWIVPLRCALLCGVVLHILCMHANGDAYDDKCNEIIAQAQASARFHNADDVDKAEKAANAAQDAFDAAKKMQPDEPQAYANMAVFKYNTNSFDESLELWALAKARIESTNVQMHQMINSKVKDCHFGKASMARDAAYAEGQGNITEAIEWGLQQLQLKPSPTIKRDVATMMMMKSEVATEDALTAHKLLTEATQEYFRGWLSGQAANGVSCSKQGSVLFTEWTGVRLPKGSLAAHLGPVDNYALVKIPTINGANTKHARVVYEDPLTLHAKLPNVAICGNDGVLTSIPGSTKSCWVQLRSPGVFTDLAANVQLVSLWSMGAPPMTILTPNEVKSLPVPLVWHNPLNLPNNGQTTTAVQKLDKAISLVSMATRSYYHWVTEALARLVGALHWDLLEDPDMRIIVPADDTSNRFISQYMNLLDIPKDRLVLYNTKANNDERIHVKELHNIEWTRVKSTPDPMQYSHCLVPKFLLNQVRSAVMQKLTPTPLAEILSKADVVTADSSLPLVVVASRQQEKMRILEEEAELISKLTQNLRGAANLLVFVSSDWTIAQAISIFSQAKVVIGVHGGALANTVFCQTGTTVMEIGFRSALTQHYQHIAAAQGLRYTKIRLAADEGGVGRHTVRFPSTDTIPTVVAAVKAEVQRFKPQEHKDEL